MKIDACSPVLAISWKKNLLWFLSTAQFCKQEQNKNPFILFIVVWEYLNLIIFNYICLFCHISFSNWDNVAKKVGMNLCGLWPLDSLCTSRPNKVVHIIGLRALSQKVRLTFVRDGHTPSTLFRFRWTFPMHKHILGVESMMIRSEEFKFNCRPKICRYHDVMCCDGMMV